MAAFHNQIDYNHIVLQMENCSDGFNVPREHTIKAIMRKLLSYSALISDILLTINNENIVCNQTFTISSCPSWKHLFDALAVLKMG
jgi:hypothetical protein